MEMRVQQEQLRKGQCIGAPIQCPASACEETTCEPAIGCVSLPVECDDGDECPDACNLTTGLCE